ncbi:hypothetical protein M3Y99_00829800 [Aphelenchoides fujianensis]|nr:hypothetical protein M3Y99_00829800 [Aphelenchoides fujianensis]
MGSSWSSLNEWWYGPTKILMVSQGGAGKTTILYRLVTGKMVQTIPSCGFNVEPVTIKNTRLTVWDIGGLVFVVDAASREELSWAKDKFSHLLNADESEGKPVLILANKQDLPNVMSNAEILEIKRQEHVHCARRVNIETVTVNGVQFLLRDIGGGEMMYRAWPWYAEICQAVIFVVDAANRRELHDGELKLSHLLYSKEAEGKPLLVFANKQDLPNVMSNKEIVDELRIIKFHRRFYPCHIQQCCTITGEGLAEGFAWLIAEVNKRR